jgi:hypothetical protein
MKKSIGCRDVACNVSLTIIRNADGRNAPSDISTEILQQPAHSGDPPHRGGDNPQHSQQQHRKQSGDHDSVQASAQNVRDCLSDQIRMPRPQKQQLSVGDGQGVEVFEQAEDE